MITDRLTSIINFILARIHSSKRIVVVMNNTGAPKDLDYGTDIREFFN